MTSDDDAKRGPRGTLRLTPKPRTERLSAGDTAARSRASKSGTRDDRARRADPRRTPAPEDAARDPRGPVLLPGIRVGDRFEIVELTDEGATARIYKADQVTMGRTVALKMVHVRDAPARARKRVRDEIRALIRLDHPNVVRIIDAGQWDDWIYVVEEWLRGTTLRRFMLERGRVPRKEALELAVQMLAGLGAAHAAKIVHRDLKPENVFVTETGAVKLLDFGLAKSMDASGSSSRGLLVGTPGYMAPERLMPLPERVKNDPRADLFSFGVILYEMLAGAHPYKFGRKRLSAEQLALYMASFDPPVLAAEPLELWKLIARTISRYPDERPASADIIVRELRRILAVPALPVAPPDRSGRSQLVAAVARSVLAGTLAGTAIGYSAFAVERSLWPPQHNEDARLHADERASAASAPTPAPSLAAPPEPARTQATPAPARPPAEAATTNPKPEKPPRERRVAARAKTPVPKPSAPTPASRSSDAIRELLETPIFDDDPRDAP